MVDACAQLGATSMAVVWRARRWIWYVNVFMANPFNGRYKLSNKGTGHAVTQAIELAPVVLIAYGDVPLIRSQTLPLADGLQQAALCILTTQLSNPTGYGRIVRNTTGQVQAIVEEKDATPAQRSIQEVNTGFMAAKAADFKRWLAQLTPQNAQGEYYLTDCVGLAVAEGLPVNTVMCADPVEVEGANNRVQLARLERACQLRQVEQLMLAGVTAIDPARLIFVAQCLQDKM